LQYEQSTHLIQIATCFPMFWNVASAWEWDYNAQMVWWYCAFAHFRWNQARNQVLRFWGGGNKFLGGKIFVFITCFNKHFLNTTKWEDRKNWGEFPSNTPRGYRPGGNIGCRNQLIFSKTPILGIKIPRLWRQWPGNHEPSVAQTLEHFLFQGWPTSQRPRAIFLAVLPRKTTSCTGAHMNMTPSLRHSHTYLCSTRFIVKIPHQHDTYGNLQAICCYACYLVGPRLSTCATGTKFCDLYTNKYGVYARAA